MLIYGFYCSLCKTGTISRQVWTKHLLQEAHQVLARSECVQWGKEIRERSIVANCNFDVGENDMLIKYFSSELTLVSDFVWSADNPKVAVIQLESRNAVMDMISSNGGPEIVFSRTCKAKLRRGMELMDIQWSLLLSSMKPLSRQVPVNDTNSSSSPRHETSSSETPFTPSKKSRKASSPPDDEFSKNTKTSRHSRSKSEPLSPVPAPEEPEPSCSKSASCASSVNKSPQTPKRTPPKSSRVTFKFKMLPPAEKVPLGTQLKSIQEAQQISEDVFSAAQNVIYLLQPVLEKQFQDCSVHIFRNWNLKFRHDYSDYLLIYVTKRIPNEEKTKDLKLPWKSESIDPFVARKRIMSSELHSSLTEVMLRDADRKKLGLGDRFKFSSGFSFNLITTDDFLIEAQLGRLIGYLCTFDERCIPLLSLVHHWAKSHKIMFQESDDLLINQETCHCIGEPTALEWMVMLFLCREGLIPTPREIQNRHHREVPLPGPDVDVGFTEDPEFTKSWKNIHGAEIEEKEGSEQFALSVIKLAQQFFQLFGNALSSGSWILNTRDGQLLSTYELLSQGTPIPEDNSFRADPSDQTLTQEEIEILGNLHKSGGLGVNDRVIFDQNNDFRVYIVNPLYVRWRLSISNQKISDICEAMKKTGEALREFLQIWEKDEKERESLFLPYFLSPCEASERKSC